MQQNVYYNQNEELDDELNIDLKKIFMVFWSRREIIVKVFLGVFLFFIFLTPILPKKYNVAADLYINKSNNTNLVEVNPYAIEELGSVGGGMASLMSGGFSGLSDELEIIMSPLIMDKVVRDNNIVYGKRFGIIPGRKYGEYIPGYLFAKSKSLSIENKKGTNVITIEYKSTNPEKAYNVVCSIIANYIDVTKQLHYDKAKKDTKVLEDEYNKVKANLHEKISEVSAIPPSTVGGGTNINAMSAFSKSAQMALSSVTNRYVEGTRSNIAVQEESLKMAEIAKKLQWAKMVEEMSDSTKVLVLREPVQPRKFEYCSPKLLMSIFLGIVFGSIAAFWTVVFLELKDNKVSYSKLGEDIIYDDKKSLFNIQKFLVNYKDENITCIIFDNPEQKVVSLLSEFKNLNVVKAAISTGFIDSINQSNSVILLSKIGKTDADIYKSVKESLKIHNKQILKEILI